MTGGQTNLRMQNSRMKGECSMSNKGVSVDLGGGLARYLAAADETTAELQASDSLLIAAVHRYDEHFRTRLWTVAETNPIALILFMNAYQTFLAGVRTALGGHSAAAFPVLRTALESAAYGGLIVAEPELAAVWTNRHRDADSHKACRKTFTFDKAIKPIEERAPSIYALAVGAYDNAIDFGAHPNLKGVFGHVAIDDERTDGMIAVTHTSLYGATHIETIRGLCACLDFGLAIIGVIAGSLPIPPGQASEELQALSDLKNKATAPYTNPEL